MALNLKRLRDGTNYPVYRTAVGLMTIVGYLLAAAIAAAGLMASSEVAAASLLGAFAAGVIVLVTHLVRELLLMAADTADAVIEMATPPAPPAPEQPERANLDW